jgi:ABC-type dipeptide/oligopeptide/nickel transport system permease subunit
LALGLAAAFSPSLLTVVLAIAFTWWGHFSRVIHGMVLSIRDCEYVEAARALGAGHFRIILHHIFPNVVPPVLVLASLDLGLIVLAVATLSYLGLGIQPPAPEWGMMLKGSRLYMFLSPHLMIFPGLMIFITVLAANLFGDALRDVLDPRRQIEHR